MVLIRKEITTTAWVDIETITRNTIKKIGYIDSDSALNADSCTILSAIGQQSSDIHEGIDDANPKNQGAGDQGIIFFYATNETEHLMPEPITYEYLLMKKQSELRKKCLPWLRPDTKS